MSRWPEDVLAEQHLALAALEAPEVDLGLGQDHPLLAQLGDPPDRQVHPPAADLADQPGDQRQVAAAQADDDVVDLADLLVGGREYTWQRSRADRCTGAP